MDFVISSAGALKKDYYLKNDFGKVHNANIHIIDINMEKIMKLCYDNENEIENYKYLFMLDSEDIERFKKLREKDKVIEEFINEFELLNNNLNFVWALTIEQK